jgi:hypothetical protein
MPFLKMLPIATLVHTDKPSTCSAARKPKKVRISNTNLDDFIDATLLRLSRGTLLASESGHEGKRLAHGHGAVQSVLC